MAIETQQAARSMARRTQITAPGVGIHRCAEVLIGKGPVMGAVDSSPRRSLFQIQPRIALARSVNHIQHPEYRGFFGPVQHDMAVHVSRMDAVIGKDLIDKVEFVAPRDLDREEPVMKSQGTRNGEAVEPDLTASHDGRGADKILLEQRRQLVALEVPSMMFAVAS